MGALLVILIIAYFVLLAFCAIKESKVTGVYKAFGVYGRLKAYLALDFTLAGAAGLVGGIWSLVTGNESVMAESTTPGETILVALLMLALLFVGILMYVSSYRKCPDFLKSKCIISMIITGMGVTIKICIFFLGFVWKLTGPQEMIGENGQTVYLYDGDVYDGAGNKIGIASPDRTSYVKIRQ